MSLTDLINQLRNKTPLGRLNSSECATVVAGMDKLGFAIVHKDAVKPDDYVTDPPPVKMDDRMAIKERDERGKIVKSEGGGRIKGARNLLQAECLSDILRHWRDGGHKAIDIVFKENPTAYLKTVAGILPKELLIEDARKIESMTDDELDNYLDSIRRLQSGRLGEGGGGADGGEKPTLN